MCWWPMLQRCVVILLSCYLGALPNAVLRVMTLDAIACHAACLVGAEDLPDGLGGDAPMHRRLFSVLATHVPATSAGRQLFDADGGGGGAPAGDVDGDAAGAGIGAGGEVAPPDDGKLGRTCASSWCPVLVPGLAWIATVVCGICHMCICVAPVCICVVPVWCLCRDQVDKLPTPTCSMMRTACRFLPTAAPWGVSARRSQSLARRWWTMRNA